MCEVSSEEEHIFISSDSSVLGALSNTLNRILRFICSYKKWTLYTFISSCRCLPPVFCLLLHWNKILHLKVAHRWKGWFLRVSELTCLNHCWFALICLPLWFDLSETVWKLFTRSLTQTKQQEMWFSVWLQSAVWRQSRPSLSDDGCFTLARSHKMNISFSCKWTYHVYVRMLTRYLGLFLFSLKKNFHDLQV